MSWRNFFSKKEQDVTESKTIGRREVIKRVAGAGAAVSLGTTIPGCAKSGGIELPDRNNTLASLDKMQAIKHSRPLRYSNPKVLTYDGEDTPLIREGSVTVFFAKKGSAFLKEVEGTFGTKDKNLQRLAVRELSRSIWQDLGKRKGYTVEESLKIISEEPVVAEARYGSKQLADNLVLPSGVDFGIVVLPYNGGILHDEDFQFVEYFEHDVHVPGSGLEFEAIIVKRRPNLSKLEEDVLSLVPDDLLEMNIANAVSPGYCVAIVLVITVLTALGEACMTTGQDVRELPPEEIQALGPLASARELLNLRRQSFYNR